MASTESTKRLSQILKLAFGKEYTPQTIEAVFGKLTGAGVQYKKYRDGTQFINSGTKLDKVYLLLTGKCHVVKFSAEGKSVIADTMEPIQIFGLYELLSHGDLYSATITAVGKCSALEISGAYFRSCLEGDIGIALQTLEYLALVMEHSLAKNDSALFHTGIQNLAIYLYGACSGQSFPHTITSDRKTMSEELNINLRTLYRYIDKLKGEGTVSIVRGKIVIDKEQAAKLWQIIGH